MATDKPTTRTTVTLEDDLKAWLEVGAARNRRDLSAHLNAVLDEARSREGTREGLLERSARKP